jgi:hypothetical protein
MVAKTIPRARPPPLALVLAAIVNYLQSRNVLAGRQSVYHSSSLSMLHSRLLLAARSRQ